MNIKFNDFLNEKLHTIAEAENVIRLIKNHISDKAILIGGFGKGKETSEHDIDILIPDIEFNIELKNKLFKLLNAESVEDTDWGGWYFNNTDFGDIDIFYTTSEFDY
jgi:predicted nucleotidyltransferase